MPPKDPHGDDLIGVTIAGRYRIISRLGVGGMGTAYRAWDEQNGVPVVIKIPKKVFLEDQKFAERFYREIRLLQGLVHPHIVPITDVGDHDGLPFVVLRFLPGGSLSNRRLRDENSKVRPNPPGMLHLWLPAVAEALDYVHSQGVVHRDVKPANIFFDAFWGAYLGDFGIAKIVEESDTFDKEHTLTATHMGIGTQEYMCPEQFTPKAVLDGRADQYALAVMVYEMVAGTRPFTGATAHLIVEVTTQQAPPLQIYRRDLPPSLVEAVHRGLAKNPAQRFLTCREFAAAVLQDVPPLESELDLARLLCPNPKCSSILKLPTSAAGRKGKCPKCQMEMKVADDLGALWLLDEARRQKRAGSDGERPEEAVGVIFADEGGLESFKPVSSTTPIERAARKRTQPSSLMILGGLAAAVLAMGVLVAVFGGGGGGRKKPPKPPVERTATYEEQLAAAQARLTKSPEDQAANEIVGSHWCFRERAWDKGLSYLAKGKTQELVSAAKKETQATNSGAVKPGELIRAAKSWWQVAAKQGDLTKEAAESIRKHAADMYGRQVSLLKTEADVAFAKKWLEEDGVFRELVGNKQPVEAQGVVVRNSIGIDLKLIPAGTFQMGSNDGEPNEKPVHEVRITRPFYLGVTEVTNAQWKAVMGSVPSQWKDDNRPVEQVTWDDAVEFCKKLSELPEELAAGRVYRLPTETEWEYACRAETTTRFSFADDEAALSDYGWFNGNAGGRTNPVGKKRANPWGLYDMHGNVSEWCSDSYAVFSNNAATDPQRSLEGSFRVRRGGSWNNATRYCQSASRGEFPHSKRWADLGFRVALSLPANDQASSQQKPDSDTKPQAPPENPADKPELAAAYAKLKQNPSDAAANGVIGRILCFNEEKWPEGLPFLSKGDQADFARTANAELVAAGIAQSSPGSLVQIAKKWWMLASRKELNTGESTQAIRKHAVRLYLDNVTLLKTPLDLQFVDAWLDADKEFRDLVKNKRSLDPQQEIESVFLSDLDVKAKTAHHYGNKTDANVGGRRYENSIYVHPRIDSGQSRLEFSIDGRFNQLSGAIGIFDDSTVIASAQVFWIVGDGKKLWESQPFKQNGRGEDFRVDVSGVKKLELCTESKGPRYGAHCVWVEPRLVRLKSTDKSKPEISVGPDPGTLSGSHGSVGKTFSFSVVGSATSGWVWGSNPYTADSRLSKAAVHAGVLRPGESGVVQVTILPGQQAYEGSTRNGVTSGRWGPYSLAYQIEGAENPRPAPGTPDPGTLSQHQASVGQTLSFSVVGSATSGWVWGSNPYTADSRLSKAAVHAGVLRPGESGVVRVTILPGQQSYEGSTRNGVTSARYGAWSLSYRIEREREKEPAAVPDHPVVGRWRWFVNGGEVPGHEFLPNGIVKDRPDASWLLVDPKAKRYQFLWGNGKFIDVMTLSPDGKTLQGKNNEGTSVAGNRID